MNFFLSDRILLDRILPYPECQLQLQSVHMDRTHSLLKNLNLAQPGGSQRLDISQSRNEG
jgi:hypothetical protein